MIKMPTLGTDRFVSGIFKRELKNRFLCEVVINNQDNICYVPSSCHLSNFLSLENKKVILIPTNSKNTRTQYSLLALPYKRSFILLNSSLANKAIENSIYKSKLIYANNNSQIYINKYAIFLFIFYIWFMNNSILILYKILYFKNITMKI